MIPDTLDPIHEGDSLSVEFTVEKGTSGVAKDVTGAGVEIRAIRERDGTSVDGSYSIPLGTDGKILGTFTPGQLLQGDWRIQCRATIGGEVQTLWSELQRVLHSNW